MVLSFVARPSNFPELPLLQGGKTGQLLINGLLICLSWRDNFSSTVSFFVCRDQLISLQRFSLSSVAAGQLLLNGSLPRLSKPSNTLTLVSQADLLAGNVSAIEVLEIYFQFQVKQD